MDETVVSDASVTREQLFDFLCGDGHGSCQSLAGNPVPVTLQLAVAPGLPGVPSSPRRGAPPSPSVSSLFLCCDSVAGGGAESFLPETSSHVTAYLAVQ